MKVTVSKRQIRVLLVDDQMLIGKLLGKLLETEPDIVIQHCSDPEKAVQCALEADPTIMLLDLVMPKVSGLMLLERFRALEETRNIPIVVLSGKEEADTKAKAFSMGANDYLVKFPDAVELIARIRHHSESYIRLLQLNEAFAALTESRHKLELRNRFIQETFGKFLSDDVVSTFLENPGGVRLGGEEKNVTIMMTDLRGFTSMSERMAAPDVVALINNFLGIMTEIILRYHGTIIEFLGDAIFAVFGAPSARAEDAANAVACALEMQGAMPRVNEINRSQGLPQVEMGIGLNTGRVAVGPIGSDQRIKYGVVGRHVNLAARIESYTVGGQVLVSASTVEAVGPILLEDGRLEVHPKGVQQPLTVHRIIGIGGTYNIHVPDLLRAPLVALPEPLPVRFSVNAGKDAGEVVEVGALTDLSLKEARITSRVVPPVHANVKFCLARKDGQDTNGMGDLYGKVLEAGEDGFRIHFTSMPPQAEYFLRGMLYFRA
jgi:adenylate cyclase